MSRHILVITLDSVEQARLDAGELVFPELPESHDYEIVCPEGNGCSGWVRCTEPHEDGGTSVWYDRDEYQFHGIVHTWRQGHGWTVPLTQGCIVTLNGFYELPDEYEDLPIGEHEIDDDWDDESCTLQLASS